MRARLRGRRLIPVQAALWLLIGGAASSTPGLRAARADHDPPHCLAMAVYWESKGCGRDDMAAVGAVVLNRLAHSDFPDEVCAVVKQGGEQPPCQFSWWCDGRSDQPDDDEPWAVAQKVASQLLRAPSPDPTGGALFFHSNEIDTPWTIEREQTAQVGCHVFYR